MRGQFYVALLVSLNLVIIIMMKILYIAICFVFIFGLAFLSDIGINVSFVIYPIILLAVFFVSIFILTVIFPTYFIPKISRIFDFMDRRFYAFKDKLASKGLYPLYNEEKGLSMYQNFKTISTCKVEPYSIIGSIDHTGIRFLQMHKLFRRYSVAMITIDRYELGFKHIHITPKTNLNLQSDHELEWIEYNKAFINTLENPRQAREVLTPTFMEALVAMQKKYSSFDVEYF